MGTNTTHTIMLSALESIRLCGLARTQVHYKLLNEFYLPTDDKFKCALEEYFMYFWSGAKLRHRICTGIADAQIQVRDGAYNIIYHNCTPHAAFKAKIVKLSFRKAIDSMGIPAYVLVKLGNPEESWKIDERTERGLDHMIGEYE